VRVVVFQPWITTQTKRLIRNKSLWYQKAKQKNDANSWKKYKEYKKLAQKSCRKSHDNYVEDLITSDSTNKKFWTYVKSQRNEKTGISDLTVNNKIIQDPKEKANLFNEQFSKVFSNPDEPSAISNLKKILIPLITLKFLKKVYLNYFKV
jgi:capsular polysaccharide biosynthesis protein